MFAVLAFTLMQGFLGRGKKKKYPQWYMLELVIKNVAQNVIYSQLYDARNKYLLKEHLQQNCNEQ